MALAPLPILLVTLVELLGEWPLFLLGPPLSVAAFLLLVTGVTLPLLLEGPPFAVAAFLLLVTWLGGLLLIKRFGSYVFSESRPAAHPLVRRYLLTTGLLSIAFMAVAVLYADYAVRTGTLVTLAMAAFLLLYPRYLGRLGDRVRKPVTVALLVWAGMVVVFAAVFALFGAINFPKEGAFEAQLALDPRPQSEHDAWNELVALTRGEETDEEALLEFYVQNVASVPDGGVPFQSEPRIMPLNQVATSELEKVTELLDRGDGPAANERYLRLWTAADNMVTGNMMLMQHLVGLGYVGLLISYYLDGNSEALRPSVREIESLSASIDSKLEDSFANSMAAGYLLDRNVLLWLRGRSGCALLSRSCASDLGWPFYDEQKTMREYHDYHFKTIETSRQPFYAAERDAALADLEKLEERFFDEYSFGDIWTNAYGTLVGLFRPPFSRFISAKDVARARLSAFSFVLEATATGNLGDPPIDPLTGKPFTVSRTGDTVEISSAGTSMKFRIDSP